MATLRSHLPRLVGDCTVVVLFIIYYIEERTPVSFGCILVNALSNDLIEQTYQMLQSSSFEVWSPDQAIIACSMGVDPPPYPQWFKHLPGYSMLTPQDLNLNLSKDHRRLKIGKLLCDTFHVDGQVPVPSGVSLYRWSRSQT
ncbi:hypothetical protein IW261DRAFT_1425628 [Armillaria novae-zelandiae]|uniref:Uncharacterized protein n=1 Tax=Armillaria novae-zelandiae TaxID=153914 RepID=A0AA39NSE5_9AGAR|nr:hypothetical protein IW261DRAFT_1430715 [Armillaria novae-zelandiae]KAK0470956.1 hypothetical protein IW261DRAFT_1425628 [Armillaria novae-zelandiae]